MLEHNIADGNRWEQFFDHEDPPSTRSLSKEGQEFPLQQPDWMPNPTGTLNNVARRYDDGNDDFVSSPKSIVIYTAHCVSKIVDVGTRKRHRSGTDVHV